MFVLSGHHEGEGPRGQGAKGVTYQSPSSRSLSVWGFMCSLDRGGLEPRAVTQWAVLWHPSYP